MATLSSSANNTPVSTISRARASRCVALTQLISDGCRLCQELFSGAVAASSSPSSRARFQRESWMSSVSDDEATTATRFAFSASDLTLLTESADLSTRSSIQAAHAQYRKSRRLPVVPAEQRWTAHPPCPLLFSMVASLARPLPLLGATRFTRHPAVRLALSLLIAATLPPCSASHS